MGISNSKLHRELIKDLIKSGKWSLMSKAGRRHAYLIYKSTGYKFPIPSTPSDHRAFLNFRSHIRRIERTK